MDMSTAEQPPRNRVQDLIALGKDLVALLRDAALFILALLLIAFPGQLNTILERAGFEEGSVVGFKWKSKLIDSDDALKEAQATISALQGKNDELLAALADANARPSDPQQLERLARLKQENQQVKDETRQVQDAVSQAIVANGPLVEKALSASDSRPLAASARSDFSVGLQTLGVDDAERVALNDRLRAEGYGLDPVTWSYPAGGKPSWFAPRSTVFYYSSRSLAAARELAGFMKSATGQTLRSSAGLGWASTRHAGI